MIDIVFMAAVGLGAARYISMAIIYLAALRGTTAKERPAILRALQDK